MTHMKLWLSAILIAAVSASAGCSSDEEGGGGGAAGAGAGADAASGAGGTSGSGGTAGSGGVGGSAATTGDAAGDVEIDAGPPATCAELCAALLAAGCPNFVATQTECEEFCSMVKTGACGAEWSAILQCTGPTPQIACDTKGEPTFAGCFDQEEAFDMCEAAAQGDGG